jgi:hypothetical protein
MHLRVHGVLRRHTRVAVALTLGSTATEVST